MKTIFAPDPLTDITCPSIFLAGSIEMGKAERWQDKLIKELEPYDGTVLNPRRPQWDASWKQSIDNPLFKEQVTWEIASLEKCDLAVFYFDPDTFSPITLFELGKMLERNTSTVIVCCPEGFWRKGNIEIYADLAGVVLTNTWEEFVGEIHKSMELRR